MDGYDGVMRVGISATECDFKSRNPEPEEGGNISCWKRTWREPLGLGWSIGYLLSKMQNVNARDNDRFGPSD